MKVSLSQIKKSPIDFLYIFASKSFCQRLGNKVGSIIWSKRANQIKLLNTAARDNGSTVEKYGEVVRQEIINQYGIEPTVILARLAAGETVAGKNWQEGVFGIGSSLRPETYVGDPTVSVNPQTGKLYATATGEELADQTPIYAVNRKGKAYVSGYSASQDGKTYTTSSTSLGKFYANTYATAETQQFANGQPYDPSQSGNMWESVVTYAPFFQQMIEWILSLFGQGATLITPKNTRPSQQEFTYQSGLSSGELLLLLGGAAAIYSFSK